MRPTGNLANLQTAAESSSPGGGRFHVGRNLPGQSRLWFGSPLSCAMILLSILMGASTGSTVIANCGHYVFTRAEWLVHQDELDREARLTRWLSGASGHERISLAIGLDRDSQPYVLQRLERFAPPRASTDPMPFPLDRIPCRGPGCRKGQPESMIISTVLPGGETESVCCLPLMHGLPKFDANVQTSLTTAFCTQLFSIDILKPPQLI